MTVPGPRLYPPSPPLADSFEYFGYWDHRVGGAHASRALPRGAATIVIDVGGRPEVDFFGADRHTRLTVPPPFLVGAGTASFVTRIDTAQTVMTVHFRPAGARVGLLEAFLLSRMESQERCVHPDVNAVLQSAERHPSLRVADAVALTGLSPRRLIDLFRAQVGLTPKAYLRVRRLQAALRCLDDGTAGGAAIAAELGYFDQAHFVREFRAFTETTPTEYQRRRSWLPGHVDFVDSDKNIQDGRRRHPR